MQKFPAFRLALLALAALCATACYRYEDGPSATLKKPEGFLVNVEYWRVKEVVKTMKDNTQKEVTSEFTNDFVDFNTLGDLRVYDAAKFIGQPPHTRDTTMAVLAQGTWNFLKSKKNTIEMLYTYQLPDLYNDTIFYFEEHHEEWEIRRLTETELWLKNDSMFIKYIPSI